MTPRVSAVAYVHDYARWVGEVVESVLGQSFGDLELFFLDDGSTDGTGDVVRRYAADPRLRYERQERRGRERLHETFNRCLQATRGELIAVVNGDDVLAPDKLERQVALLDARREIDVCFHDARFVDGQGRDVAGSFRPDLDLALFESGRLGPEMFDRNWIPNPTVVFRRELIGRIGLQEYGWAHDYQFWLKAAVAGCRFAFLPERLIRYRVHEQSHSTSSSRLSRLTAEVQRMQREMRARYTIDELYPDILFCGDRERARAVAHADLGLKLLASPDCRPHLALAELRQAAELRPDLEGVRNDLAVALLLTGDGAAAAETLHKTGASDGPEARNLERLRAGVREGYELMAPGDPGEELLRLRAGSYRGYHRAAVLGLLRDV